MPDFEIRYFRANGTLAVVHVTSHETIEEAELCARDHLDDYARFEIHELKGAAQ